MLRASYGRFNQGVLTGELSPIHPGVTSITTMAYDAATGGYTSLVSVVDPNINLALDPEHPPATHRRVLGRPRSRDHRRVWPLRWPTSGRTAATSSRGPTWAASIAKRRGRCADGRSLPVFVLTNSTAARRFLLTNPDGLLADLQRAGGGAGQAPVQWLAGVRVLYVLADLGTAGVQRGALQTARNSARSLRPIRSDAIRTV